MKSYIVRALVSHISSEEGFEEQVKGVKQEIFLESSFYIRVEGTIKEKHLGDIAKAYS